MIEIRQTMGNRWRMQKELQRLGKIEGWVSVGLNTILFALKLAAGLVTGSVAMIADAWHTLSDSLTSVVLLFGLWISAKAADEKHPFGHGRAEVISAVVIGTLLAVVGLNFCVESIARLRNHETALFKWWTIGLFLLSGVVKEALARFSIWAGKKTASASLLADGWHHRSDAIASILIVVGAMAGMRWWWLDGVMGIAVAVLILHAAYEIIRQASNALLGETMPPELESKILDLVKQTTPDVGSIHHFHLHRYGDHAELTFHVRVPANMTTQEAHAHITAIEKKLHNELQIEATIHAEPC